MFKSQQFKADYIIDKVSVLLCIQSYKKYVDREIKFNSLEPFSSEKKKIHDNMKLLGGVFPPWIQTYHDFFVDGFLHIQFFHFEWGQFLGKSGCRLGDGTDLIVNQYGGGGGGGGGSHGGQLFVGLLREQESELLIR